MRSMDYEICSSIPHLGLGRRLNEIRGGRMNKKMISVHPSLLTRGLDADCVRARRQGKVLLPVLQVEMANARIWTCKLQMHLHGFQLSP